MVDFHNKDLITDSMHKIDHYMYDNFELLI